MKKHLCAILVLSSLLVSLLAPADNATATEQEAIEQTTLTAVQNWQEDALFYIFAGITVIASLGVVLSSSVVRMAMWLFAAFGAVAMLFFLMQAHFLAVVQLIVYVGGILVLIIFGIMLTSSSPWVKFEIKKWELLASGGVCLILFLVLSYALYHTNWESTAQSEILSMDQFGRTLLTDYLVPFEVASVLLLVVMVGAAFLAKQEKRS